MDIFLKQHNAQLSQCLLLLNLPGLSKTDALDFARKMGFSENCMDQAAEWMLRLYDLFIEKDATMIEINPMSEDLLGRGKTSCHVYFTHSRFKDKNKMYAKNHFIHSYLRALTMLVVNDIPPLLIWSSILLTILYHSLSI